MTREEIRERGVAAASDFIEGLVGTIPEGTQFDDAASGVAIALMKWLPEAGSLTRELFLAGCLGCAIAKLAEERRKAKVP
jgi:hypothetical protein